MQVKYGRDKGVIMDQEKRLDLMTKYRADSILGNMVRKLLVAMVLTEVKEEKNAQDISIACENLLNEIENREIPDFIARAEIILDLYKEIADNGISVRNQ